MKRTNQVWRIYVAAFYVIGLIAWCILDSASFWPFLFCGGQVLSGLIIGVLTAPLIVGPLNPHP